PAAAARSRGGPKDHQLRAQLRGFTKENEGIAVPGRQHLGNNPREQPARPATRTSDRSPRGTKPATTKATRTPAAICQYNPPTRGRGHLSAITQFANHPASGPVSSEHLTSDRED